MYKNLGIVILLLISFPCFSQYYYKDIVSIKQANDEMAAYMQNKVRKVKIKSFEPSGELSEGFFCEKIISKDFKKSDLFTKATSAPKSQNTSYYNSKGLLESTLDSSDIITTRSTYFYDADSRLLKITSAMRSEDDDFVNTLLEDHVFIYGEDFYPDKMYKIKNRTDSSAILFSKDEHGNISVEKDLKTGSIYYYYYDEKSRLTDIVHSTEYNPRLIADYIFEYDAEGNLVQMISTEAGNQNYLIWKYTYDKGLLSGERCYDKKRKLLGYIEYEYL